MSKEEETLPKGWVKTTLNDVTVSCNEKVDPLSIKPVPYISLKHIESVTNRIISHGMSTDVKSLKSVFHSGDVLYGKLRPYLNKVSQPEFKGVCSTDILVLAPSQALDNRFLLRLLSRIETIEYANRNSKGINLPRISLQKLGEMQIKLPPLNEQKRIVAKIEEFQARSRRAREALETVPELLEQLCQSILAAAFRGDLTRKWREQNPDVEPASELLKRIRTERRKRWEKAELEKLKAKGLTGDKLNAQFAKQRKKYKEPEPVDTTDLPELPEGWCWATLADLALIKGGLTKGKKRKNNVTLYRVPYLRVANVQRGYLDLNEVFNIEATAFEIEDLTLQRGDILLNEGGDLDKLGRGWVWDAEIEQCIHQNHVFRARLVDLSLLIPELISTYINAFGQKYFLRRGKQTTNLASVSLTNLSKIPVPIVPKNESLKLWENINSHNDLITKLECAALDVEDKINRLNQSILSKAFRGELVPQNPNDEPASILLERIRQEKARQAAKKKSKPARKSRKKRESK